MKQAKYIGCILLLLIGFVLRAEEKSNGLLITDRDVYGSGEYLLVKAFTPINQNFNVLYLGLTSVDGKLVVSAKLNVKDHQTSGYLYLPDSLQTGSFLLGAYSPHFIKQEFFCKEIFVVNRFLNPDENWNIKRADLPTMVMPVEDSVKVQGLKTSYGQREKVSMSIQLGKGMNTMVDSSLSIVVSETLPGWKPEQLPVQPDFDHALLLTTMHGVVMEGKVENKKTNHPVGGAMVYLSIPDSIPYFDYYRTGEDGRFYFLLKNFYGIHPVVVQAEKKGEDDNLIVRLNDHFSIDQQKVETKPIELSAEQHTYFSDAVSAVTFQKIYQEKELHLAKAKYRPAYPFPFYGKPEVQVDPDQYFELSNFNEISKELLQPVRFRERKDGYSLTLINHARLDFFPGPPLILMDGVPVQKVKKIAGMGSKDIDWIDVVPYERFYGDLRFNGVLAIYTKAHDAGRIEPSDRVLKLDYETLQGESSLIAPVDNDPHSPDFRQVLLWKPKLKVQNELQLNFMTSDILGTFKVQITGRNKKGEIVQSTCFFNVTK